MSTQEPLVYTAIETAARNEQVRRKTWRTASLLGGFTLFIAVLASRSFDLVMMFQDILRPLLGEDTGQVVFAISIVFTLLIISLPLFGALFIKALLKAIAASTLDHTTITTKYVCIPVITSSADSPEGRL